MTGQIEYLLGKHRAKLLEYCQKKKIFYQAEACGALHWPINTTQYHLHQFVKHGLLTEIPTRTKTYYKVNQAGFPRIFS